MSLLLSIRQNSRQISRNAIAESQAFAKRSLPLLIFMLALTVFLGPMPNRTLAVSFAPAPQQGKPHLYFFTNDGCAPCRQVEPAIEALDREGYPVTTLKLSESQRFAQQFQIDRTPTVVMVANNQMVGRHAGLIDAVTLKKWFAAVGMPNGSAFSNVGQRGVSRQPGAGGRQLAEEPVSTKVVIDRTVTGANRGGIQVPENFSTPTMHKGVARPNSEAERRAMLATVRLKVEDTQGISYATGTVVHTHGNESLVMTCGHVFRDSNGQGVITAEYNFYSNPERASGRLIDFDAGPRDIALVAIKTRTPIQPVRLAGQLANVQSGLDVFSLGCDKGADPTIRRTKIKNRAAYDGSIKYDIFGRPVDGRSGGGLFSADGQLLGVCNAAAVEVDEGIYTALETIHWELANTGLDHLFSNDDRMVAMTSENARTNRPMPDRFADSRYLDPGFRQQGSNTSNNDPRITRGVPNNAGEQTFARAERNIDRGGRPSVNWNARPLNRPAPTQGAQATLGRSDRSQNSQEVVILVRSKQNSANAEEIRISDPTPELLEYLKRMR